MLENKETMTMNSRVELRTKARKLKGLMNLLADDIRNLNADAEDHDLLCLVESIQDVKETLQMFTDGIVEIEYSLYLAGQRQSRNLQSPL
jgi:hypothetical protein